MSYSFVQLYLFKCDVCVLNYIQIKPKRFLIILYVFGSDFYHSLCLCLMLTLFFIVLSKFSAEKQVSEFLATHSSYSREQRVLATRFGDSPSHKIHSRIYIKWFHDSLATYLTTRQSRNTHKQLFKGFFVGNLFLNLSHPLLNRSFNIFTSKPNQFEWFLISLTSLR